MKTILIILTAFGLFYITAITLVGVAVHGTAISSSTEEKYIRNIKNTSMLSSTHVHYNNAGDSLSFIAKPAFSFINPIYKWYIEDVGQIKRHTRLCDMLDSMSNVYDNDVNNRQNKLK